MTIRFLTRSEIPIYVPSRDVSGTNGGRERTSIIIASLSQKLVKRSYIFPDFIDAI